MIVCPNCNHQNPEGATQCEACYTPLPATISCPSCGATVQSDATFCGQCGSSLPQPTSAPQPPSPDLLPTIVATEAVQPPAPDVTSGDPVTPAAPNVISTSTVESEPIITSAPDLEKSTPAPTPPVPITPATQLQQQSAQLVHVQTSTVIELPQGLSVIHLGKPNDLVPPDVDVSGFPNSEIVSRKHADIRVEADAFYIEDVGSSNGTYINNIPLSAGNRHRLRPGDRISLGKGDLVSFIFQMA